MRAMFVQSRDGVRLAVHELGGDGPPVLLAHATGFHARVWDVFHRFLGGRGLAPDARAHGDSEPPPDGSMAWPAFGHDIVDVLDALAPADRPRVGVGHSMGGAALLMAELERPGTFDRLFLFEPIVFPGPPPDGENHLAAVTRHRRETFESYGDAIDRFASKPPLGSLRADVLWSYVHHGFAEQDDGSIRLKCDREMEARTFDNGSGHRTFEQLGDVRCPTLVAAGNETEGPAMIVPAVAAALPAGESVRFDHLGHFGPLEDPPEVAAAARSFLWPDDPR